MGEGSMSRLMAPRGLSKQPALTGARGKSLEAVGRAVPAVAAGGTGYHPAAVTDGLCGAGCIHAGGDGQSANEGQNFLDHGFSH